ncbi:MAG: BolA family protein [Acidiferrobacterales bacterium]
MSVQSSIEQKLNERLHPLHLEVINESHMHSVPPGSESHFKVTVVSQQFEGKNLVARHRIINEILAEQLTGPIHALALHPLTPDEWFDRAGGTSDSPPCHGGSKADG